MDDNSRLDWETPILYQLGVPGTLGGKHKNVSEAGHIIKATAFNCHVIGKFTSLNYTTLAGASLAAPGMRMTATCTGGPGTS